MTMAERAPGCVLCKADGGEPVRHNARTYVVLTEHARSSGSHRVIWNDHVAEQTGLSDNDRYWLMKLISRVECMLCTELVPDKISLASLGDFVPHLYWHVIPCHRWDIHSPETAWGPEQRAPGNKRMVEITTKLPALSHIFQAALADA